MGVWPANAASVAGDEEFSFDINESGLRQCHWHKVCRPSTKFGGMTDQIWAV
jgi:hypothetical protein